MGDISPTKTCSDQAFFLHDGISAHHSPLRAEKCNLCLRNVLLPMSRNGHQSLKLHFWFSVYIDRVEIVDGACFDQ